MTKKIKSSLAEYDKECHGAVEALGMGLDDRAFEHERRASKIYTDMVKEFGPSVVFEVMFGEAA